MTNVDTMLASLNEMALEMVLTLFSLAFKYRPKKAKLYAHLAALIIDPDFPLKLANKLSRRNIFICSDAGFLSPKLICGLYIPQMYILPELAEYDPDAFRKYMANLSWDQVATKCENNWAAYREWRLNCTYSQDHIAIINDDIETLSYLFTTPYYKPESNRFSVDSMTLDVAYDRYLYRTSLLGLAALYGSFRCFRFLMLNGALAYTDSSSLMILAIAGGNTEIIQIVLENCPFNPDQAAVAAVRCLRNDVLEWILLVHPPTNDNWKQFIERPPNFGAMFM